jgi:hypothetical protein
MAIFFIAQCNLINACVLVLGYNMIFLPITRGFAIALKSSPLILISTEEKNKRKK